MLLSWPDFTAEVKFMVELYQALKLKEKLGQCNFNSFNQMYQFGQEY